MKETRPVSGGSDVDLDRAPRGALSFAGAFVGWVLGGVWYVAAQVLGSRYGRVTDLEPVSIWSALFVLVTWACVMRPLARRVERGGLLVHPLVAPLFGAACGWVACLALLAPLGGAELAWRRLFAVQALVTGGAAWAAFALTLRVDAFAARPRRTAWSAVLGPFVLAVLFAFALWPVLERVSPRAAYRFGTSSVQQRVSERAIRALRVGDPIEALSGVMSSEVSRDSTSLVGNLGDVSYRIHAVDGRVTSVEIDER